MENFLAGPNSGTISDEDAGNTEATIGEQWFDQSSNAYGTYVGFITVNGETLHVFDTGSGGRNYLGNVSDPSALETAVEANKTLFANATIDTTSPVGICFAAGTLIATPKGDARVEDLVIGTLVMTVDGRAVPVKWIGRQTVVTAFWASAPAPSALQQALWARGCRTPTWSSRPITR